MRLMVRNRKPPIEFDATPWERQQGESDKAWEAWIAYRDAGSSRTIDATAKALGKGPAILYEWSRRYQWRERIRHWSNWMDMQVNEASAEVLRETKQRHLRLAQLMLAKYLERVGGLKSEEIPVTMLDRLLRVGTDVELASIGAPDQVVDVRHGGTVQVEGTIHHPTRDQLRDILEARKLVDDLSPDSEEDE